MWNTVFEIFVTLVQTLISWHMFTKPLPILVKRQAGTILWQNNRLLFQ